MNFLRAVSSATARRVWQHQLRKTSGIGHKAEGVGGPDRHPLHAGAGALAPHHLPLPLGGLLQAVQHPFPGEDPNVSWWVPVLGQAAWQGRQKGVQVQGFPWGTSFAQTPALRASPGGCHGTRCPTNTRCPKNAIAMSTPRVKPGVGSPTVTPICWTWILKTHSLRNFLLCPGLAGFPDVRSQQLSILSLVLKGSQTAIFNHFPFPSSPYQLSHTSIPPELLSSIFITYNICLDLCRVQTLSGRECAFTAWKKWQWKCMALYKCFVILITQNVCEVCVVYG